MKLSRKEMQPRFFFLVSVISKVPIVVTIYGNYRITKLVLCILH